MTLGDRVGISGLDGAVAGLVVGLVVRVLTDSLLILIIAAVVAGAGVAVFADRLWSLFDRNDGKSRMSAGDESRD